MVKKIVIAVVVLLAGLLLYAATRPDTFEVRRAVVIQAPPQKVYPLIEDFHRWTVWSPWEKLDPDLQRTYSGPDAGEGATYAWSGNGKAGAGQMRITRSEAQRVTIDLDFEKPFKASNVAEFVLQPVGGSTEVTWRMTGKQGFMHKLMGTVMNMDAMVGRDFEAGLQALKTLSEGESQ